MHYSPNWGDEEEEEIPSELVEFACFKGDLETVLQNTALQYPMFLLDASQLLDTWSGGRWDTQRNRPATARGYDRLLRRPGGRRHASGARTLRRRSKEHLEARPKLPPSNPRIPDEQQEEFVSHRERVLNGERIRAGAIGESTQTERTAEVDGYNAHRSTGCGVQRRVGPVAVEEVQ